MDDILSQFFGGGGPGGFGSSRQRGPTKGQDLVHRIQCTLRELYEGKKTNLALNKSVLCSDCDGKGGKASAIKSCSACRGQGVRIVMQQRGPLLQQFQVKCEECAGKGEIIPNKDRCKTCKGEKTQQKKDIIEVNVDKGMKDGDQIKFAGASDQKPGQIPGDVIIVIQQKPHDFFTRKNNDLYCTVHVPLLTALGGGEFSIQHLDDRALVLTNHPGEIIKPGSVRTILNQGMPTRRHHDFGKLFVTIEVDFPESLDETVIPALESALPARTPLPEFKADVAVEHVDMNIDDMARPGPSSNQGKSSRMDEDDDDDEDEGHGHGPGNVQCAQQ